MEKSPPEKRVTVRDIRDAVGQQKLADALDRTQWATGFEWPEIVVMAQTMRAFQVAKGTVLWEEGDAEQYMGIIVRGTVDILKSDHKDSKEGKDVFGKIATLGKGQSLGEMCLIDKEPRSARAIAASDLIILLITIEDINILRDQHTLVGYKVVWKLAQMLSQRLRKTSGQLVDFLCDHE